MKDAIVEGTLAWCNAKRKEKGMNPLDDLPKGIKSSPSSCPCGAATGLHVGCYHFGDSLDKMPHALPDVVTDFVHRFDNGKYPEYDLHHIGS